MELIAVIDDERMARKILSHLGLPTRATKPSVGVDRRRLIGRSQARGSARRGSRGGQIIFSYSLFSL